eukprot:TRINITY_DN12630_c0_g3_i1.p1 TRINITY_DN12630_c0_g3~~TRINITY_DN12630_c0_g3_i1.p1  ORF type:complete len:1493 (+),score=300.39 TRINITY_DN12630_c0_g3_i1:50-4480(+)
MPRPLRSSVLLALLSAAGGQNVYWPGDAVIPWANLKCADFGFSGSCGCGDTLEAAMVHVEQGYQAGDDEFACPGCAGVGIATNLVAWSGVYELTGPASLRDYAAAIASVTFVTNSWRGSTKKLQYTLAPALFSDKTKHFYKYFAAVPALSWQDAQTAAAGAGNDIWGLVGYLATIADATEKSVLVGVYDGNGFIGAADYGVEGEYRWVTGPEGCPPYGGAGALRSACGLLGAPIDPLVACAAGCGDGTAFAQGNDITNATDVTEVTYMHFKAGEPDGAGDQPGTADDEDFMAMTVSGWIDARFQDSTLVPGYYVEWGGVGTLCVNEADVANSVEYTPRDNNECAETCPTCEAGACAAAAPAQVCNDPDVAFMSKSTWECQCVDPYYGDAETAGPAECKLNECNATCATCEDDFCTDGAQECNDPDLVWDAVDDWECSCIHPKVGGPLRRAIAACELDECLYDTATCRHCADTTCTDAGQDCEDQNTHPDSPNNWRCLCKDGAVGAPKRLAPAACILNECTQVCATCSQNTCVNALPPQRCEDLDQDPMVTGDWRCHCVAPETGDAEARAADCELDECKAECPTCARGVCNASGQECIEKDHFLKNDWKCSCIAPAVGADVFGGAASCKFNECVETCGHCAGTTCSDAIPLQDCIDPNPNQLVAGDWECRCVAPLDGAKTAAVADCFIDECEAACATCEDDLCSDNSQTCHDPDQSSESVADWNCTCPPGSVGTAVQALAGCFMDECETFCSTCENDACIGSQVCEDPEPDLAKTGDWWCRCTAPFIGESLAGTAQCTLEVYDECVETCATCANATCSSTPGQSCEDRSTLRISLFDWECRCQDPLTGSKRTAPAECVLDECTATCATCAGMTCAGANQNCVDDDKNGAATGDWKCVCKAPEAGENTGALASCALDECAASCSTCAGQTCQAVSQECNDTDTAPTKLSDWTCTCRSPRVGSAMVAQAVCVRDECTESCPTCAGDTCRTAQQDCDDPDTSDTVLSDWKCTCRSPLSGFAFAAPAQCMLDECEEDCQSCSHHICRDGGQACDDLNRAPGSLSDWVCRCTGALYGQAEAAVAVCIPNDIDECTGACPTCENGACGAEQQCRDRIHSAQSLSDWECHCEAPAVGTAALGPAVCRLDECQADCWSCEKSLCSTVANQTCHDPVKATDSVNDWTCSCRAPDQGVERAGVAACMRDECAATCATCESGECQAAGQDCTDPNHAPDSLGDWECSCRAPGAHGSAVGKAAVCNTPQPPPTPQPPTWAPNKALGAGAAEDDDDAMARNIVLILLVLLVLLLCLVPFWWHQKRKREKEKEQQRLERHLDTDLVAESPLQRQSSSYAPPDSPSPHYPPAALPAFYNDSAGDLSTLHQKVDLLASKVSGMQLSQASGADPLLADPLARGADPLHASQDLGGTPLDRAPPFPSTVRLLADSPRRLTSGSGMGSAGAMAFARPPAPGLVSLDRAPHPRQQTR